MKKKKSGVRYEVELFLSIFSLVYVHGCIHTLCHRRSVVISFPLLSLAFFLCRCRFDFCVPCM